MQVTKASLLVVDDEPSILTSLSQLLTEEGYSVRCASEGFSALAQIRREIPDTLISDLNMPGMSGFELLSIVRRRFPAIQVIAMSGAHPGPEVPSGTAADAFFQKGGSSIGSLLRIMQSLPRPERMAQHAHAAPPPVWVSKYQRNSAGEGYAMIECPECLGTFPKILKGTVNLTSETNCLYCGGPIRYSVVQPNDRTSFQTSLSRLRSRHSAPAAVLPSIETLAS